MMVALRDTRAIYVRDLAKADAAMRHLAERHRDTVMAGRTHGQQGLPITFGFKIAGWIAEIESPPTTSRGNRDADGRRATLRRCREPLLIRTPGVRNPGALSGTAWLRAPIISWTSSRDILAEWCNLLVLMTATADRVGHEIYNLQRSELGEVSRASYPAPSAASPCLISATRRSPSISARSHG